MLRCSRFSTFWWCHFRVMPPSGDVLTMADWASQQLLKGSMLLWCFSSDLGTWKNKLNGGIFKAFQMPRVMDRTSFGTLPWHFGNHQPGSRPNSEHFWASGLSSVFGTIYVVLFSDLKYRGRCSGIFRLGPIFRTYLIWSIFEQMAKILVLTQFLGTIFLTSNSEWSGTKLPDS